MKTGGTRVCSTTPRHTRRVHTCRRSRTKDSAAASAHCGPLSRAPVQHLHVPRNPLTNAGVQDSDDGTTAIELGVLSQKRRRLRATTAKEVNRANRKSSLGHRASARPALRRLEHSRSSHPLALYPRSGTGSPQLPLLRPPSWRHCNGQRCGEHAQQTSANAPRTDATRPLRQHNGTERH